VGSLKNSQPWQPACRQHVSDALMHQLGMPFELPGTAKMLSQADFSLTALPKDLGGRRANPNLGHKRKKALN